MLKIKFSEELKLQAVLEYLRGGHNSETSGTGVFSTVVYNGNANFGFRPVLALTEGKTMYTVTFDTNGGIGSMDPQVFAGGVAQTLTVNTFTKEGHKVIGWATSSTGTVTYADGASIM